MTQGRSAIAFSPCSASRQTSSSDSRFDLPYQAPERIGAKGNSSVTLPTGADIEPPYTATDESWTNGTPSSRARRAASLVETMFGPAYSSQLRPPLITAAQCT